MTSDTAHGLRRCGAIAATLLSAIFCSAPRPATADPTAVVIGKAGAIELSETDLRRLVGSLPEATRGAAVADSGALERVVRGELLRRLVVDDARNKGFERDPAAKAEIDRAFQESLANLWLERQARVAADFPSENDIATAYGAARARSEGNFDYRLSQIFIALPDGGSPEKLAASLRKLAELQGKIGQSDFAALAKNYSEDAESAAKGGDLGVLPATRLLPEIRTALATMTVGGLAGPLKTSQGLHYIKLVDKRPAVVATLAEVRTRLVAALRQQRASELQQQYLTGLTGRAPTTVNQVELARLQKTLN